MTTTKKLSMTALIFCAICVALNIVLGAFVSKLIPILFLDTIGTIFVAVVFGPWAGVITGLATNLILGLLNNPREIAFALISMMVGLIAAYVARRYGFKPVVAIITGIIMTILCSFFGSFIAQFVYGGVTGTAMDMVFLALKAAGQNTFDAIFTTRVIANLFDKVMSCLLVSMLIMALPKNMLTQMGGTNLKR